MPLLKWIFAEGDGQSANLGPLSGSGIDFLLFVFDVWIGNCAKFERIEAYFYKSSCPFGFFSVEVKSSH